jgi:hypothetical protein
MAFTRSTDDLNIIAALNDEPNAVGGLTAAELKAKFDAASLALQKFINAHIDELAAPYAAANIGAVALDNSASNLQAQLEVLQKAIVTAGGSCALITYGELQ